ncbi:hypothetical protein ACFL0M_10100 [Thermodesulfobacteriota bacterium]
MKTKMDFKELIWRLLPFDMEVKHELKRERSLAESKTRPDREHLAVTAQWLIRAHSASKDDGVSRGYRAAESCGFGPKGWQASYPETTGYIIPTMFALADYFNADDYRDRASRMADWEIYIQLPSGAVMGSVVTAEPSPAIFNTGQVILGWLAAFQKTGDQKYLEAALRAGHYLVSVQEPNGSWIKGNSMYALNRATAYNTRVAWALIELGMEADEAIYKDAGRKNLEYALTKQHDNGWISDNCLTDPLNPLIHTIVYATRGFLESGVLLKEDRYVKAALKTLDALLVCQRSDGGIPGRLAADWSPRADWDCLTGDAQVAVAWLRAHAITGDLKYENAAHSTIEFIKRSQNLEHTNPGIRGGVKGSFPFDGPYGKYNLLNWAAKFFCDALMLANDQGLRKKGIRG